MMADGVHEDSSGHNEMPQSVGLAVEEGHQHEPGHAHARHGERDPTLAILKAKLTEAESKASQAEHDMMQAAQFGKDLLQKVAMTMSTTQYYQFFAGLLTHLALKLSYLSLFQLNSIQAELECVQQERHQLNMRLESKCSIEKEWYVRIGTTITQLL